jgi:hypothetical protein
MRYDPDTYCAIHLKADVDASLLTGQFSVFRSSEIGCRGVWIPHRCRYVARSLPPVFSSIIVQFDLTRKMFDGGDRCKAEKIHKGEVLRVNIGSATAKATVKKVKDSNIDLSLDTPL